MASGASQFPDSAQSSTDVSPVDGAPRNARSGSFQLAVLDWGRTDYRDAWERQTRLVEKRIAGEIGDTLVFTEHEPVFTLGLRRGAESNLVWNEERRAQEGVRIVKTNRGGDITYHGPGQIVGYPVVSLATARDLHAYLRFLEQVVIDALATFSLTATRRDSLTGIWLGRRKIAAIGVAVRRWIAYHGFALNVDPDLRHFSGIVPCGIGASDGTVTSMRAELGHAPDLAEVKAVLAREFREGWAEFLHAAAAGSAAGSGVRDQSHGLAPGLLVKCFRKDSVTAMRAQFRS